MVNDNAHRPFSAKLPPAFAGAAAAVLAGVLTLAGHGPARAAPAPAAPDSSAVPAAVAPAPAELDRLVETYNRWAAGLRNLKAGGRARVGAAGEPPRTFDFSMLLARPAQARIQGRWGSLATLFDLSGDPHHWTLYLPRDRAVVRTGEGAASAGLLLPPVEVISVLLPAGIPPGDLAERGAATVEGNTVRLVVPPGRGGAGSDYHRVVVLDRSDGKPLKLEFRRKSQLEPPVLIAEYTDYEGKGAEAFPFKVRVTLPGEEQWARFDFETVRLNTGVAGGLFDLRVPPGTRELAPEDLTPDFLPVAEDGR